MATTEEFERETARHRRELLAHCYRMLGSAHEAEDAVQETYLRAWRAFDAFEGRASTRTWLYRIATRACLTALERRGRRPLPSGLGGPASDARTSVARSAEVTWLEPLPDRLLGGAPPSRDPAQVVEVRGSVRLAMAAALQLLPARQRAVLLLREVLAWPAAEVAEALETSVPSVNSALQRARARLRELAPDAEESAEPPDRERRRLLDRYVAAFESADAAALTRLLRDDVELEMPPYLAWFTGRADVGAVLAAHPLAPANAWRMLATGCNGQPAAAGYLRGPDGVYRANSMHVLTVTDGGIARIVVFLDSGPVALAGLPMELGPDGREPAGNPPPRRR